MGTKKSRTYVFAILAALVVLSGCGKHESPLAPTPTPTVNPQPVAGTQVAYFPLPETDQKLVVWITGFSPAKDTQLADGQSISVGITCGGPIGYEAVLDAKFVSDPSEPIPTRTSGSLKVLSARCNGVMSSSFTAYKGMPEKKYIRIMAWVGKSPTLQQWFPPRPPDYHFDQWVGYKSPQ